MLIVEPVDGRNAARFVAYATTYGPEHDTSFLPDPGFEPPPVQPTYLLVEAGADVGAVSLLLSPRFVDARRARFALFHSRLGTSAAYRMLLDAARAHLDGIESAYLFIPASLAASASILVDLGFHIERYSYALTLETPPAAPPALPGGLRFVPVHFDDDLRLRQYAATVNRNFGLLAGHLDLSIADMKSWYQEATYLDDGIALLLDGETPIGTYTVSREYEDREAADIGGLSINPERRGKGLGRVLLRHAVGFARARGLHPIHLSVNAENESALTLYLTEGFRLTETVVCYALDLR